MSEGTDALLEVSELSVSLGHGRGRTEVLREVDLEIAPGEIVGVIGETGSGKTTLARAILGLAPVQAGTIRYGGRDITRLGRSRLRAFRRSGAVQYVFQDPLRSLDPDRTVADTLVEGLAVQGGRSRTELQAAARGLAELSSLPVELLPKHPGELSGGQRQRVAIARAMAVEPALLICDEPVSALDATTRIKILELLLELRAQRNVGVLLITHDLGSLGGVADRVVVLYRGSVVETGRTDDIFNAPQHPYTRLLVESVPSLFDDQRLHAGRRAELRAEVRALDADTPEPAAPAAHR